jgi:hypothetical protein
MKSSDRVRRDAGSGNASDETVRETSVARPAINRRRRSGHPANSQAKRNRVVRSRLERSLPQVLELFRYNGAIGYIDV